MPEKEQEKTKFQKRFFVELLDFLQSNGYIKNRKRDRKQLPEEDRQEEIEYERI